LTWAYYADVADSPDIQEHDMPKIRFRLSRSLAPWALLALAAACGHAGATGLATCDSGPKSGWQPVQKLEEMLKAKGWTIRRVKEDGGCYEVYAFNEKNERGEYYFHPVTLAPVPTRK
jgi:hypothetical protein